ncbi:MAG: hypothetical protein GY722_07580 [bacterium]|nr:hypothetical protein [bacterium]
MSEAELRQVAEMVKHCSHRDGIGMGWQEVERALNGAAAELAALREKCERLEGDTNDAEAMLEFLQKENSRLRTQDDYRRAETYREGLEEIQGSCEAYPESVFPEMESDDWTRVRFIVENAGYTRDRLSASYLRMHKRHHLGIARETLEKGEKK